MIFKKKNIYYGGLRRKLIEQNKTSIDSFNEFINIVGVNRKLTNASLLIGISYGYSKNLNREIDRLEPDFCWSEDSSNREFSNSKISPKNQWYQLFFPFSINPIYRTDDFFITLTAKYFDEESNKIEQVFEYFQKDSILNKFSLIVFDSSTSKFLFPSNMFVTFPSFISYLFYYFLQVGGELYIDLHFICSSLSIFQLYDKEKLEKLKIIIENRNHVNNMKETDEIFGQKFMYIFYEHRRIVSGITVVEKLIINGINYQIPEITIEIIRKNNIEYLRRNLLGSNIEYFPNESETKEVKENRNIYIQPEYPIKKTNYLIGPFIKITKTSNLNKDNIEDFRKIFSVIYNDLIVHRTNPETPQTDLDGLNCLFI